MVWKKQIMNPNRFKLQKQKLEDPQRNTTKSSTQKAAHISVMTAGPRLLVVVQLFNTNV